MRFRRLPLTSPARTWVDMASLLDLTDLIILGDPSDRLAPTADLGYRDQKIAIQYDGRHHRTASQQASDAYRDAWFQERGWLVIRLTSLALGQGFSRLIQVVRRRFEAHGNSATA
ncbi:hypothetical protein CITRIK5_60366 [Citricoccus sp. K5]|nr:hypothetical protein CITRIK5_60366 [Citricoccus sp. K5]